MRTVFNNDEIPHLWAHQTQETARNANKSYWFQGPILYSYRTPIAVLATNAKGETAAVLTTRTYSITTTSHQSSARRAVDHLTRLYVPELCYPWGRFSATAQRKSLANHLERLAFNSAAGRNRISRAKRFDAYRSAVDSANQFCAFFDLELFPVPESAEAETALAEIRARNAERDRLAREKAEREKRKQLREARRRLKDWIAGESLYLRGICNPYILQSLPTAYMRIDPHDPDQIETSLGARVPTAHVKRFAPHILAMVRAGREYLADPDRPIRFGPYYLDSIDAKGTVSVGCHRFERKEIERVARLLGIESPAELAKAN